MIFEKVQFDKKYYKEYEQKFLLFILDNLLSFFEI